jgi:ATP-dependent Clp protease ATP-binding subunit ClpC
VFQRFTARARDVVVSAQDEARLLRHNYIGTEHLLLGLLRDADSVAGRLLAGRAVGLDGARVEVARIIGEGDVVREGEIPFTPRAKKVLERASRAAERLDSDHVDTGHILFGVAEVRSGVAARVLVELGVDLDGLTTEIARRAGGTPRRRTRRLRVWR